MAVRFLSTHISIGRQSKLSTQSPSIGYCRFEAAKSSRSSICHRILVGAALPDSSTAIVSDKKEAEIEGGGATPPPAAAAKAETLKAKKAPAKPLPEMMEEDIIPSLRSTLEDQEDISQIEISFQENRLEGSFLKKDKPYYFWAFFPNGVLTGSKGFALSSYGLGVSTVEPFLIDERKITAKHVVFWIRKRLIAQGILPVWKEE